jgi:putative peptidoglycan lipid II flippase
VGGEEDAGAGGGVAVEVGLGVLGSVTKLVASTVVTRCASAADTALPKGGVGFSSCTYAQTTWSLPQSVITLSLVTALLPRMSQAVAEHRLDGMRGDLSRALRISGVVIVPAAFFFVALGPQMAQVVFAHGAAHPASIVPLGQMLQAFGLGLTDTNCGLSPC